MGSLEMLLSDTRKATMSKRDPQYVTLPEILELVALINSKDWSPHDVQHVRRIALAAIRSLEMLISTTAQLATSGDFRGASREIIDLAKEISASVELSARKVQGYAIIHLPDGSTIEAIGHKVESVYTTPSEQGFPWDSDREEPKIYVGSKVVILNPIGEEIDFHGYTIIPFDKEGHFQLVEETEITALASETIH